MLKVIGAGAVVLTGFLMGLHMSSKLKGRVSALEAMQAMVQILSIEIRYRALSVYVLAETLVQNPALAHLEFLEVLQEELGHTRNFPHAWEKAVHERHSNLCDEDVDILLAIGTQLGASDTDGQLSALALHTKMIEARLADAKEDYMRKGKMYRSLGLLLGIGISIMIL